MLQKMCIALHNNGHVYRPIVITTSAVAAAVAASTAAASAIASAAATAAASAAVAPW